MKKYFSEDDIFQMAQRVARGLGISLREEKLGRVIKIKPTIGGVAARAVLFLVTETNDVIPVLTRLKTDSIGNNMTFANPVFREEFYKNYALIQEDLQNENFDLREM